jgi:hypothetical protein
MSGAADRWSRSASRAARCAVVLLSRSRQVRDRSSNSPPGTHTSPIQVTQYSGAALQVQAGAGQEQQQSTRYTHLTYTGYTVVVLLSRSRQVRDRSSNSPPGTHTSPIQVTQYSGAALQVQAGAGQEQQQPSRHTHLTYTGYTVQWCYSPGPGQVRDRRSNSPPGTHTSPVQDTQYTHKYTVQWCYSPGPGRCGTGAATVPPAHTPHLYRIHSTVVLLSRSRQVRDRSSNSPPGTHTSPIQDTQYSGATLQVQAGAGQEQQHPSRHTHLTYTGYTVHTLVHSTLVLLYRFRYSRSGLILRNRGEIN